MNKEILSHLTNPCVLQMPAFQKVALIEQLHVDYWRYGLQVQWAVNKQLSSEQGC